MEEKKEYLNEERYNKTKNTIRNVAIIIFVVGLLIGGGLIAYGLIKTSQINKQNADNTVNENTNVRTASDIQADIDSTQTEIDTLELKIQGLRNEQQKIFTEDKGFSDRYYAKGEEITKEEQSLSKLRNKLTEYESELWKIQSGFNDTKNMIGNIRNKVSTASYTPVYFLGGFIIIASGMISLVLYLSTKRRELMAYHVQQRMPVIKETVEEATPVLTKTTKEIVKEMAPVYADAVKQVVKGVKEGLKEEDKK